MLKIDRYLRSLRDGRHVFINGTPIPDVASSPGLGGAVASAMRGYERSTNTIGPHVPQPRSTDDLHHLARWIGSSNELDAATALVRLAAWTAGGEDVGGDRARRFIDRVAASDLRIAIATTDPTPCGLRHFQEAPDLRLLAVDDDGVTLRGTTTDARGAAVAHELLVMPNCESPPMADRRFVAAVPVNGPGVTVITAEAPGTSNGHDGFEAIPDAIVVFQDVRVPHERLFVWSDPNAIRAWQEAHATWRRFFILSALARRADMWVGLASLMAEANGLAGVEHIKDKVGRVAEFAAVGTATLEAAITGCRTGNRGIVLPDDLHARTGLAYAAGNLHVVVRDLADIAGGSLVTAPSVDDLTGEVVGPYVRKYMRTMSADGEMRTRLFHALHRLTVGRQGHRLILDVMSGTLEASSRREELLERYDVGRARKAALGILEQGASDADR